MLETAKFGNDVIRVALRIVAGCGRIRDRCNSEVVVSLITPVTNRVKRTQSETFSVTVDARYSVRRQAICNLYGDEERLASQAEPTGVFE